MFGRTIEQVYEDEAALETAASDRRRKLAELKQQVGDVLLDNPEQEADLTEKILRATTQCELDASKVEASRRRRMTMAVDARRKQAADLRTTAARARADSEAIVKRVSGLLAKIAEAEGLTGAYDISVVQHHAETPRHVRLVNDAEAAEAEARRLEEPVRFDRGGRVTAESPIDLYRRTRTDPAVLAPTLEMIEAWVALKREKALQKFGRLHVDGRGLTFLLEYRGAEIGDSALPGRIDDADVALAPQANVQQDPGALYRKQGFADPYDERDDGMMHFSDGTRRPKDAA